MTDMKIPIASHSRFLALQTQRRCNGFFISSSESIVTIIIKILERQKKKSKKKMGTFSQRCYDMCYDRTYIIKYCSIDRSAKRGKNCAYILGVRWRIQHGDPRNISILFIRKITRSRPFYYWQVIFQKNSYVRL